MSVATSLAIGTALLAAAILPGTPAVREARAPGASAQLLPGTVKALARGKMLIASRDLPDPNFARSVVLVVERDDEGTMGLIVNRQSDVPLSRVFPQAKPGQNPSPVFYLGGPVQIDGVMSLLRSDVAPEGKARHIFDDVYLIAAREPLEHLIASGIDQAHARVYVGYAGWSAGQLEHEAALGAWQVLPSAADIIFDADVDSLWDRLIKRTEGRSASREVDGRIGG